MSKIVFVIVGLLIGAAFSGFGGAIFGAVAGFLIAILVDRQNRASEYDSALAELRIEIRDLKTVIRGLSDRLQRIESTGSAPVGAASAATPDVTEQTTVPAAVVAASSMAIETQAESPSAPWPEITEHELETQALAASREAVAETAPDLPRQPVSVASAQGSDARDQARPAHEIPVHETPAAPGFNPFVAARDWLFGGNSLVRVGVVVLFFGLAFLLKFATEHVVVPVEVRYLGVAIGALLALGLGWRLRDARPDYAMALQGLGVAILYLVSFAAFRVHALLPGGLTLIVLVGTCVLSAALAILQNARALAVIGICGGFLAPVLTSTGGGSHVALFSYYALLNLGILGIAWFRAWRPLNVLGFLFTFGIGSLWGNRNYRDELFATTEPFLLLFFFFYLVISLLYARRRKDEMSSHGTTAIAGERIDYVDGTLVFGTPLAGFGLQYLMVHEMPYGSAFSALGLGLIYVPLAIWLYRRGQEEFRLLVESFLALGVVFASLAIPLALDAKWTSAAWAAEGAAIYWVGLHQRRVVARAFALLLQLGGGISFLWSTSTPGAESIFGQRALFDGPILSAFFVGAAGLLTARLQYDYRDRVGKTEAGFRRLAVVWGLVFLNLIFPLLLDLQWSGVAWALAGAASVYLALRYASAVTLGCGAVLQLLGGIAFVLATESMRSPSPLLNGLWIGAFLISGAGIASGWLLRKATASLPSRLSIFGLAWGLLWWWGAGEREIHTHLREFALAAQVLLAAGTALLLLGGGRLARWTAPVSAAFLLLPMLVLFAIVALARLPEPVAAGGWLAWPVALGVLTLVLRRQEEGPWAARLDYGHAIALWLLAGLSTWQSWSWFRQLGDAGSAWPVLGWALPPLILLALLAAPALRARWPLVRFPDAYRLGAAPLALGLWAWVFIANTTSNGNAAPLPYLPLANPLDLATAGALMFIGLWLRRVIDEGDVHAGDNSFLIALLLGGTTFYWLNGVLLRTLHHWAGVPFAFDVMMKSTLVQAALSLFWALLALTLMMWSTRRGQRQFWLVGGGLMAVVVAKLFLIDLSRVGSVERIVSFIGVGLLLLVLGYFSPVPPARENSK